MNIVTTHLDLPPPREVGPLPLGILHAVRIRHRPKLAWNRKVHLSGWDRTRFRPRSVHSARSRFRSPGSTGTVVVLETRGRRRCRGSLPRGWMHPRCGGLRRRGRCVERERVRRDRRSVRSGGSSGRARNPAGAGPPGGGRGSM